MQADAETHYSRSFSVIDNLPSECLIEIFEYLSSNELKSVALACRYFANVIDSSTKLMEKFFMVVTRKRKWDYDTLARIQRKHQSLVFFDFSTVEEVLDRVLLDGLENIGGLLKSIEFNDCRLIGCDFARILETAENVKHLKLINSKILGNAGALSFDFKNLTTLKITKTEIDYEIFKNARNLRSIQLEIQDTHNVDLSQFADILFKQSKLTSLSLVNLRLSNLFDTKRTNFTFQLESLKITQCHFRHKENFEIFLDSQTSLFDVELSLGNMKMSLDRTRYYESIIAGLMKKNLLRNFTLNLEEYKFMNLDFMEVTRVGNLNLRAKDTNFTTFPFLKYFPLLESLELDVKELIDENIEIINNSSILDTLKLLTFSSKSFGKIKNKNIKSLYIHETLIEPCDWKIFIENNPQILKLVVQFSFLMDFDVKLLEHITGKLKLEHIELLDKYVGFDNDVYKVICENCKNLKYIKLWNINIEKNFDEFDKDYLRSRKLKFHVFNDESLNKPMIPF